MMSTLCEVWFIMNRCLNMEYEEIANVFEDWNKSGPLVSVHPFSTLTLTNESQVR